MPFDYKKQYQAFYAPKDVPNIIEIPQINFIAVGGKGNPNDAKVFSIIDKIFKWERKNV